MRGRIILIVLIPTAFKRNERNKIKILLRLKQVCVIISTWQKQYMHLMGRIVQPLGFIQLIVHKAFVSSDFCESELLQDVSASRVFDQSISTYIVHFKFPKCVVDSPAFCFRAVSLILNAIVFQMDA